MDSKSEILDALNSGKDHEALLMIVRRQIEQGLSEHDAYQGLEGVWHELGFDRSDSESNLRDELEFVMEKLWYFGAARAES